MVGRQLGYLKFALLILFVQITCVVGFVLVIGGRQRVFLHMLLLLLLLLLFLLLLSLRLLILFCDVAAVEALLR